MVYIATHLSLCARRLTVVRSTADPLISCAAISQPRFRSCAALTRPANSLGKHACSTNERPQWSSCAPIKRAQSMVGRILLGRSWPTCRRCLRWSGVLRAPHLIALLHRFRSRRTLRLSMPACRGENVLSWRSSGYSHMRVRYAKT